VSWGGLSVRGAVSVGFYSRTIVLLRQPKYLGYLVEDGVLRNERLVGVDLIYIYICLHIYIREYLGYLVEDGVLRNERLVGVDLVHRKPREQVERRSSLRETRGRWGE